jgi:subtilisin family serine protease
MSLAGAPVERSASRRVLAASMPDSVSGPLDALREEAGLQSMRPLFVTADKVPKPRTMMLASVRSSLETSATDAPREALRGFQIVDVKKKNLTPAFLKKLEASNAIELVEPVPNRWLSARASSSDPSINRQWGLRAVRWFDAKRPDAAKVHVAVVDSGVDVKHPDLESTIEDYRHDGNKPRDFLGHGTHVSGIIAAEINNAIGIAGVANCRLHCWKVFDDPRGSRQESRFNFEFYSQALASALDSDIKVINLSLGGEERSQTEAAVFSELRSAGVVVVAAMGNEFEERNPTEYPAAYDGVLAVGAVDEVGRRARFSCTGRHIGLVAPGVNILSTVPLEQSIFSETTEYDSWPGTSMATPHVAGCAALLYSRQDKSGPAATAIVKRLTSTAQRLPAMKKAFTPEFGHGLLDVSAALDRP